MFESTSGLDLILAMENAGIYFGQSVSIIISVGVAETPMK
jgi:hypothetical protein